MAFSLGVNGGDAGDSFMDAPTGGSSRKGKSGSGSGENPLSSLFDAIGVHIGESRQQRDAINKTTGGSGSGDSSQPSTAVPMTQGSAPAQNSGTVDSKGNQVGDAGILPPSVQASTDSLSTSLAATAGSVPAPTALNNFFQGIKSSISGSTPGDGQIDGNKDGSFGGGLMKAIGSVIGLG